MTYEIYRYIFIGGAVLTGIMLVVSVLVFFFLQIPKVIGDLTGSTARKAIADIRSHNENISDRTQRTAANQRGRGEITDKISPSGRIVKNSGYSMDGVMSTEKLNTGELSQQASAETTVLTGELTGGAETTVLSDAGMNETTVLNPALLNSEFVIEYEITYIHTGEVIA